jgi:predicted sulfurtransferase
MRSFILYSLALLVALGALVACNSKESTLSQLPKLPSQNVQQSPLPPSDNAKRITADEAYELYKKGNVLMVDTRNEMSYKEDHIKGAILIPAGEILSKIDELPRDKTIITYCT